MFTIRDGREHFYTWDLDRQIVVDDPSIVEVHFCNRTDDCSLVVEVFDEDGLRVANVPNIILQTNFDVRIFGYDGKATLHEKTFKVKARTKPSDYIYTETEIRDFDSLTERAVEAVELAEASADSIKDTADNLYEFVDSHRLELVDLGDGRVELRAVAKGDEDIGNIHNYYTKTETEVLIENALEGAIPSVPENVSAFINDAGYLTEHQSLEGYATEEYVNNAIDNIPEVDLSGYAKKEDIPDTSSFISAIPSEYVTESELDAKGYLTQHQPLDEYAKKADIPDVSNLATKGEIPSLEGYAKTEDIPSIPSLDEYVTEDELNNKGYLTEHQDLSDYAKKSDIPDTSEFISAIPEEYITEAELNDALANLDIPEGGNDNSIPTHTIVWGANPIDSELLTEILKGAINRDFMLNRDYYLTLAFNNDSENPSPVYHLGFNDWMLELFYLYKNGDNIGIKGFAFKYEVSDNIYTWSTFGELDRYTIPGDSTIPNIKNRLTALEEASAPDLSEYITEAELNDKGYATTQYVNEVASVIPEYYASKEELKEYAKLTDIPNLEGYAKTEDIPDTSNFISVIPEEYITETELNGKGYLTEHQDLSEYAKTTDIPDISNLAAKSDIPSLEGYAKTTDIPDVSAYQTEDQVNALINQALGVIENGSY